MRRFLVWGAVASALAVPLVLSLASPLLQWRQPVYILAGFAGVLGFGLMLLQPLLARGLLPGLDGWRGRRLHRWVGAGLAAAVIVHVGGLWITSPPDVIDALTFTSPTPFSAWGVVAMWVIFAIAILALLRKRLGIRPSAWRRLHTALALVVVTGTVVHAVLIDGTMEPVSKWVLSALVFGAAAYAASAVWFGGRGPPSRARN